METRSCSNCAWFCHADGNCYGTNLRLDGKVTAYPPLFKTAGCKDWDFDGLDDLEREELYALVTMEEEC